MAPKNTMVTLVKIVLMSLGILFLAVLLSVTLPRLSWDIPAVFTTVKAWLRPPYLYFIINAIIITIVASSRLHQGHQNAPPVAKVVPYPHDVITVHGVSQSGYLYDEGVSVKDAGFVDVEEVKEMVAEERSKAVEFEVVAKEEHVSPPLPPVSPLVRQEAVAGFISEKPPVVSRFGHRQRPTKASHIKGGKALRRVAKPKKQDTLENTWKAITEGRHIPLTRHLKKSDTLENDDHNQINLLDDSSPIQEVKKSQTFTDRTNYDLPRISPATKLRKEPSLGQEELNRRVEAFINKFNEDMRLQRQQSMQQFMEMINRAA